MPAEIGKRAAVEAGEDYIRSLEARLESGLQVQAAGIVFAQRHGSGTRPAADVDLDTRVLLDAFAVLLADRLRPDGDLLGISGFLEPTEADRAFEERPLADESAAFIVTADVASCYEYIDHEILEQEILELAADVRAGPSGARVA